MRESNVLAMCTGALCLRGLTIAISLLLHFRVTKGNELTTTMSRCRGVNNLKFTQTSEK